VTDIIWNKYNTNKFIAAPATTAETQSTASASAGPQPSNKKLKLLENLDSDHDDGDDVNSAEDDTFTTCTTRWQLTWAPIAF
jgi:hypothetical protein